MTDSIDWKEKDVRAEILERLALHAALAAHDHKEEARELRARGDFYGARRAARRAHYCARRCVHFGNLIVERSRSGIHDPNAVRCAEYADRARKCEAAARAIVSR